MDATQRLLNNSLRVQSPRIPDGHQPAMGNLGLEPVGVDAGSIAGAGGTLNLSTEEYTNNTFGLYFGLHDDDWLAVTRAATEDLERIYGRTANAPVNLLVTVSNARLRQLEVLLDIPFSEWLANEESWRWNLVAAGNGLDRPRPLRMPTDGCIISVQFILRENLPEDKRTRDRPWRKGSWLARVFVRVAASKGSGLDPRPLTQVVRESHVLGDHCSFYVDFHGESSGFCFTKDLSDALTVYIDEDLLEKAKSKNARGVYVHPAAKGLVNRWVIDTYRTIVHNLVRDELLNEFDIDQEDHRYSITYQLLSRVSDYLHVSIAEALNILRDQPDRFVALLEGSLNLKSSDNDLLDLK
jgi:hypothetical protein